MCEVIKYVNIQAGEVLDLEKVSELKDNAMLKVKPELWCEWDFEKNSELGFDIWKMTYGSSKKVWWVCEKCNDSYPQVIKNKVNGSSCSICLGRYITPVNSLATKNPSLAKQWHPTKNGELTPNDVACQSHIIVWWKCTNRPLHEWESTINSRSRGNGCPYCANKKVWVGFNDMWTTNPELAKLLHNPEDGYKYMQGSNRKVNWKCKCGEIIRKKNIDKISSYKLVCPKCSDGISYPEKIMYTLLKHLNLDCMWHKTFKWSERKEYDFYIEDINLIIETHGEQHYRESFKNLGARTLDEEQANDKYKYESAIANGITPENYIVIDCRKSDFEFIKNNILDSRLAEIFDLSNVNWGGISRDSEKSMMLEVCEFYNNNERLLIKDVADIFNIHYTTVLKYLKRGVELGLSSYSKEKSKDSLDKVRGKNCQRSVVQLNLYGKYMVTWDGISVASRNMKIKSPSDIVYACKGKLKTAGGYKWMYKEDYDKYIEEQNKVS